MFSFIAILIQLLGGNNNSGFVNMGRKGPVDDRDLWYFEQTWVAQEAQANDDLQRGNYLDFADTASLITVLHATPGDKHSQPFINAIRTAQMIGA